MTGYTCAWCGGGHLGIDCEWKRSVYEVGRVGVMALQYVRAERLTRHVRRLRRLVVAMQEARCPPT